jgi:hypothetical protein
MRYATFDCIKEILCNAEVLLVDRNTICEPGMPDEEDEFYIHGVDVNENIHFLIQRCRNKKNRIGERGVITLVDEDEREIEVRVMKAYNPFERR